MRPEFIGKIQLRGGLLLSIIFTRVESFPQSIP